MQMTAPGVGSYLIPAASLAGLTGPGVAPAASLMPMAVADVEKKPGVRCDRGTGAAPRRRRRGGNGSGDRDRSPPEDAFDFAPGFAVTLIRLAQERPETAAWSPTAPRGLRARAVLEANRAYRSAALAADDCGETPDLELEL